MKTAELIDIEPRDTLSKDTLNEVYQISGVSDLFKTLREYHERTADHCNSVADIAAELCHGLNLDNHTSTLVTMGALLHDIGKKDTGRGIDKDLIDYPGIYSEEQRLRMKPHPYYGGEIFGYAQISLAETDLRIVRYLIELHHSDRDAVKTVLNDSNLTEGQRKKVRLGVAIIRLADLAEAILPVDDLNSHHYTDRNQSVEFILANDVIPFAKNLPNIPQLGALLNLTEQAIVSRVNEYRVLMAAKNVIDLTGSPSLKVEQIA